MASLCMVSSLAAIRVVFPAKKVGTHAVAQKKVQYARHRTVAMAGGQEEGYVDYESKSKTVFPAEACDELGGEFCEPSWKESEGVGREVILEKKAGGSMRTSTPPRNLPDRAEVDYASNKKTVFAADACDTLGGEFCEPSYQENVGKSA
eukprot:jgi/Mesvir1/6855/Mv09026-RA.1